MAFYSTNDTLSNPLYKTATKGFIKTLETASEYGLSNNLLAFYSGFPNVAANIMPMMYHGKKSLQGQIISGIRKNGHTPVPVHYLDVPKVQISCGIYCPIKNSSGLVHDASEDPEKLRNKLIRLGINNIPLVSKYTSGDDFLKNFVVEKVLSNLVKRTGLEEYLDNYSHLNGFKMSFNESITKVGVLLNSKHKDWRKDLAFFDSDSKIYEENDALRYTALINKISDMGVNIHDANVLLPEFDKKKLIFALSDKLLDRIRYYKKFTPDAIKYYGDGKFKNYSSERSLIEVGLSNCEEFVDHLLNEFDKLDESQLNRALIDETFKSVSSSHQLRRLEFS